MDMDMDMNTHGDVGHGDAPSDAPADGEDPISYFAYGKHTGLILSHIILMVLSWCFILPIGGRSRLELRFRTKAADHG